MITKIGICKKPRVYYIFDELSPFWTKSPESNLMFLVRQQELANKELQEKGYLLLNEVCVALGLPLSRYGDYWGWIYNKNNLKGDSIVNFGIYDMRHLNYNEKLKKVAFVNGYEASTCLVFNIMCNICKPF